MDYEAMYAEIRKAKVRKKARMRKRRQKEFCKTLLIIAMLLYIALDFISSVKANQVIKVKVQEEYIVGAGDTLWSIAEKLDAKEDIRDTVYRIDHENDCGRYIFPGQVLKITYYK